MVDRKQVIRQLNKVVDPEINVPITDMELVDDIDIGEDGTVTVTFHFTTPYCPPVFAYKIGLDIRARVSELEGVKKVKVFIKDYYLGDKINAELNKEA